MFEHRQRVDLACYRLSAVKQAIYRISHLGAGDVTLDGGFAEVRLYCESPADSDRLLGAFLKELSDQDLRETIAEETAELRRLLLAETFSQTSLVAGILETADYRDDPLGIAGMGPFPAASDSVSTTAEAGD